MMGTELFLIRTLFVLSSTLYVASQSPCLNLKVNPPVRYVNYFDQNHPLVFGVSNRLTHRLTTEVLKIYATEALGYPNVVVKKMAEAYNIQEVVDQFYNNVPGKPPSIMVDLESWVPVGVTISDFYQEDAREYGTMGAQVRFGWFIPSETVTRVLNASFVTYDSFLTPERAEVFSLVDEDLARIQTSEKFEPPWCKLRKCATLIASSRDFVSDFIQEDITRMRLFAKVYWIGDKFTPKMTDLLNLYSNPGDSRRSARIPIIFGDSLELLPFQKGFTYVIFPVCEPFSQSGNQSCRYEGHSIVKLGWKELEESAWAFHDTLLKVQFNALDYRELVNLYHENTVGGYREAACKWLKTHQDRVLRQWISHEPREELILAGIFPLQRTVFNPQGTYAAAQIAVDEINDSKLLGNYMIHLKLHDGDCRSEMVMRTFISYVTEDYRRIIGILGPACSETVEPLAGVSAFFETVVISYSAEGSSFDRAKYPYFFRTIGENRQYQYVYQSLFRQVGWKRVASLSEESSKYTEYVSQTQDLLMKDGVVFIANRKFSHTWMNETNKMKECLDEFKSKEARIIIADVNEGAAKELMCEAYHMNMTAKNGFVWFLPSWLQPFWKETALHHNETSGKRHLVCTTEQMLEAIDAHLSLSHAFFAPDNETILTNTIYNKTVKQWKQNYTNYLLAKHIDKSQYSDYAGYAYDAVWVYAKALNSLIRENATYISNMRSKNVTARFVNFIQNTNFSGVSGRIEFKSGASRNATRVNIFQWDSKRRERIEVGHYDPKSEMKFYFNTTAVRWLTGNGQPPWDGTKEDDCVVDWLRKALNSDCQTALVVANILGFGLVLLFVLFGFLVIKHRYDKKVQLTKEYMKSLGLDLLSVSAINGLDTWEMPKDRVVINRKLGEGAFGMVYGGEAFFEEKGWVAVAVKTLKVGSSTEQKLDFLSEAEVMKRFDHKNVVQLLGVCTKSEPVYTIMEFMLYGDMKTFLLARRHLVNDQNMLEDNDEVSSVRLTNMALDIARALSYLAELKYVHRDVASRNCLVNASRVVKLGDFGMTRTMCDNDYYKFTRKGWLPVRWMAPESLGMGVFTPASDVWSFGVLLYEIITFGNFPFQGMSNREVLDFVKEGHTLAIPNGVKANLEGLIKSCWNIDPQKRPPAAEIVEFLANNPRLLSPTLDGPLLSVPPMEESTFTMPFSADGNKTRKFSLRQRTSASPSNDLRPWTEVSEPLLPSLSGTYRSEGFHTIPEDQIAMQDSTYPL